MVVDLIGIYGLKGPYCTLTTTNWFLQALSVIPRGSWGDVARRSYHDPMGKSGIVIPEPQCINCFIMSSIKNPLAAILDSNKFTGLNYQDWLRNLNIVLASEKLLYTIEKSPPKESPADISPEELITLKQWWDDELKTRCYVMAMMSNEMQRRFEKTKYAAYILFNLKELYGENCQAPS
ncbi:hypothetical protein F511_31286 [Dorcoceras hygrometricum]|uniref:Uncharacterized protein n=1 Tax=Dorcoceras hygrometricum TaxID=472368 RepID=A0A2Z7DJF2_9LAMI|nr:hypothetical protein F511_31286 [Dorcoceras hygrometricum]